MSDEVNAAAPAAEPPRKRRIGLTTKVFLVALVILVILGGGDWIAQIPYYLVFGWFGFLRDNLAALQPNPRLLTEALLCVIALGVGGHYFCRWFYAAMVPTAAVAWRALWTMMGLGLLFLLFAAGIGIIGLTHQAAWLIGAKEPLLRDYFTDRMRVSEAIFSASPLREQAAEEFARTGRLPDVVDANAPSTTPRSIVESVSLAKGAVITITLKQDFNGGGTVTLAPTVVGQKIEWKCSSTLSPRILPVVCRK